MKTASAMERFVENAARLRIARGLSIQALADSIDMDRSQLSEILAGKNCPTLKTMLRIATGLAVDVSEFLQHSKTDH